MLVSTAVGTTRQLNRPGNHCGDLRLTVGETRAESVWALTPLVVRSLSREAITAGITGLLDRTPTERRMVTSILRSGSGTVEELRLRLPDIDSRLFDSSLALLLKDGAVSELDGILSAVQKAADKNRGGCFVRSPERSLTNANHSGKSAPWEGSHGAPIPKTNPTFCVSSQASG